MNQSSLLRCNLEEIDNLKELDVVAKRLFCFGFSGRDQEEVANHIKQLEPMGIAPPKKTPLLMEVAPYLLCTTNTIKVQGNFTSGEVEFVIIPEKDSDDFFIGVGSDHGDLEVEKVDVAMAKQMAPKILGSKLWRFSEIKNHWDEIVMRSWVKDKTNQNRYLYQQDKVEAMMHPNEIIKYYKQWVGNNLDDIVIYSGTISALGELVYPNYFACELYDPILDRTIGLSYNIESFKRSH
jgi:hypothetical protein